MDVLKPNPLVSKPQGEVEQDACFTVHVTEDRKREGCPRDRGCVCVCMWVCLCVSMPACMSVSVSASVCDA